MKILMVLTSHDQLGSSGEKTGFWLEEFATPFFVFRDAGAEITLASPKGGQPPIDPKSDEPAFQTGATERFKNDPEAIAELAATHQLSEIRPSDYSALFYPGGHGPLWDLVEDAYSIRTIEAMIAAGKPVAAVCHAPCVLLQAKTPEGISLLSGKEVTGFSNTEEAAVGLAGIVPFLLEDEIKRLGGHYSCVDDWQSHTVIDGNLITGQNPASSEATARALVDLLT